MFPDRPAGGRVAPCRTCSRALTHESFLICSRLTAALSAIYNARREMPDANVCAAVCMARSLCGSFSQAAGTLWASLGGGWSARRNTDLLPVYVSVWGLELQVQNSCHSQALKRLLHLWIIDRGKLSMPVRLKGIMLLAGGVMLSLACCWRGDATFPHPQLFLTPATWGMIVQLVHRYR